MFETIEDTLIYHVPYQNKPISGTVAVPGSKSITNRALLIAALANGPSKLTGVLFSDDSRHFLSSLISLGFDVTIDEDAKEVTVIGLGGAIPNLEGTIHVGSAGTAARFLTAMLGMSCGTYTINCSEQMKKRPMKPLFDALITMGAKITFLEKDQYLPIIIQGNQGQCVPVDMDIHKSTQFLSALLLIAPMSKNDMVIQITSAKKEGSYIDITRKMLSQFGVESDYDGHTYSVSKNATYKNRTYPIEPDMSAACYFYAIATLTGGSITVKGVTPDIMQGDLQFISVLEALGSKVTQTKDSITVIGPQNGTYKGIEVDMNNYSDQTMTLSALAVFAQSKTVIKNVSHIRLQESDRMQAIVNELSRLGLKCHADGENITIHPNTPKKAVLETYEDHRMAMAFSLIGIRSEGISIKDPLCCKKTFENYFQVLESLFEMN